ncbi:MAG: type II/IV secretion system protein [Peptococcaceae bacterium]|nr:type II/IV secretion system protein [Peptococcaceae bacterium]
MSQKEHIIYTIDRLPSEREEMVQYYVHRMLQQAILRRASDIHLEPNEDNLTIKYRIDGYLTLDSKIEAAYKQQVINRLKIMAEMDITEHRLPQDGHLTINFRQQELDIRASVLPTFYGEKIVLRLLKKEENYNKLEDLGFAPVNLAKVEGLLGLPYGMILVTGPTGCGKTTTLYSMLKRLTNQGKNIITLEDPVEYQIEEVNQVQINEKIGLTFASGLRSILRQDPDIIMVGEIRDKESAEIAIRLAYTGHLVLASLHTNDAFSAIFRLLDMGVAPYLLASCLNGVIAQRLVRQCRGKNFQGRLAIQEVLVCDEYIQQSILHYEQLNQVKKQYLQSGFRSMAVDGREKVEQGLTTWQEIVLTLGGLA